MSLIYQSWFLLLCGVYGRRKYFASCQSWFLLLPDIYVLTLSTSQRSSNEGTYASSSIIAVPDSVCHFLATTPGIQETDYKKRHRSEHILQLVLVVVEEFDPKKEMAAGIGRINI